MAQSSNRVGKAPRFGSQISNLRYEMSNKTIAARWARGETSQCHPPAVYTNPGTGLRAELLEVAEVRVACDNLTVE